MNEEAGLHDLREQVAELERELALKRRQVNARQEELTELQTEYQSQVREGQTLEDRLALAENDLKRRREEAA